VVIFRCVRRGVGNSNSCAAYNLINHVWEVERHSKLMNIGIWPECHPGELIQLESTDECLKVILVYSFLEQIAETALSIRFEEYVMGEFDHALGGSLRVGTNGGGSCCEVSKVNFLLIAAVVLLVRVVTSLVRIICNAQN